MRFKLAYVENASNKDKLGFGIKSCKKAKIGRRKADDKFWNPYVFLIMCITMTCKYLKKLVNKWQPVELPTITSGINRLYAKGKMTPKTCQMGRKRCDKSNGNFWNTYGYVKISICMICIYLTKQVSRLKLANLQTTTSDWPNYIQWINLVQIHDLWSKNETIKSIVYLGMPLAT